MPLFVFGFFFLVCFSKALEKKSTDLLLIFNLIKLNWTEIFPVAVQKSYRVHITSVLLYSILFWVVCIELCTSISRFSISHRKYICIYPHWSYTAWEYEVSNTEMVDIKPRLGRLQPVGLMSYYNSCATVTRRWNCCTSHYCGNHRRESLNFSCCCSCYSKLYYSVEKHHFQLKYFFLACSYH